MHQSDFQCYYAPCETHVVKSTLRYQLKTAPLLFQDKPYAVANNSVCYKLSNLILNGKTSCEQKTVI